MGEWQLTWRVLLTRGWGFPGPATEVVSLDSVSQLRDIVARARIDPTIEAWRFWRHREWVGADPPHACGGSRAVGWAPAGITDHACRCGLYHRTWYCNRCGQTQSDPDHGPGCGPIPQPPAD